MKRRIYAHWLDPDYLGKVIFPAELLRARRKKFESILKMHALLGDCICISDVQLIESSLLLSLFADAGFRRFITLHPDFLRLVARPTDDFGAAWHRLRIVGSGIARINGFADAYLANTFESTATMKYVAAMFKNVKTQSDAEQLLGSGGKLRSFVRDYKDSDKCYVVGLYYALSHFLTNTEALVLPQESATSTSYYQELQRVYERTTSQQRTLRLLLTEILSLAESQPERFKRSLILRKLPHVATPGHRDSLKYLTIMQAWNLAVGQTVGANLDSAYCFRGVFPVSVYGGRLADCTTALDHRENVYTTAQDDEVFSSSSHYDWAPADLKWDVLAIIRTECRLQIEGLQEALCQTELVSRFDVADAPGRGRISMPSELDGHAHDPPIGAHLKSLTSAAGEIVAKQRTWPPAIPGLVSDCTVFWFVGVLLSTAIFHSHWPPPAVAGAPTAAAHGYKRLRDALISHEASVIGEALQLFGIQYGIVRS